MAPFRCDECEQQFSSKVRLATHIQHHCQEKNIEENRKKDQTDLKCKFCSEFFGAQIDLEQHVELIHKKKPFRCSFCSFSSKYKKNLKNHEISKHQPMWKEHRCLSCGALFATKSSLQRHEIMHTGQFPVSCPQCGKGFRCEFHLKRHLPTHAKKTAVSIRKKPGFQCDKCPEVFAQSAFLEQHKAKKHPKARKKFTCEHCEFSADRKSTLKRHCQRKHLSSVLKKYQCQECRKAFECPSQLQIHGSVHSKQKPFACKDCGKSFTSKGNLTQHNRYVHLKQKPFMCGDCGKSFSNKQHLSDHLERKKGEKVECQLCDGKMFANKESLQVHQRRLHGDQPWYKCQFCPMGVTTKAILKRHEERHRSKPVQID